MQEKIKYNGHTLKIYTSIQDLPITRFQIYNRSLMIDAGIGSDLNDFDNHIGKIYRWIEDNPKKASKEVLNMRQQVYFLMANTTPEINAFVALIKEIDGVKIKDSDLTDEGIAEIIKLLGRQKLTIGNLKNYLSEVKKNSTTNLRYFFQISQEQQN